MSAGQTAAVACGPACAGVAGYLTTIDARLQFAGAGYDLYNAGQYVTGKTSLADATFATVTGVRSAARALSVIPGVGIGWDAAMLAYDIVDPLIPSEQWGSVKGAR